MSADELAGATVVEVVESRWHVRLKLQLADGRVVSMIASADAYYTDRDHIWWGTAAEYDAWPNDPGEGNDG